MEEEIYVEEEKKRHRKLRKRVNYDEGTRGCRCRVKKEKQIYEQRGLKGEGIVITPSLAQSLPLPRHGKRTGAEQKRRGN